MQGGIALLSAELACVVRGLNEAFSKEIGSDKAKEQIMMAVNDAFKSEDELEKELVEKMKHTLKLVFDEVFGCE